MAWLVVSGALAGCWDIPQETLDDITCTDICRCLPQEMDCAAQCEQALTPVSEDCFEFASANAQQCSVLLAGIANACRSVPEPEEDGEEPL